ncbi:MAG: DUF454 domain-containing protein [Actinobacteria bacterium]|nr:DUF454 domain-containing protein [Actinomycetota bacterium]
MDKESPHSLEQQSCDGAGPLLRPVLIFAGSVFLAVAVVGVVVPLLPTTPLLILSAVCYARSSDRCYRWLVTNKFFGPYLDDYLHGRGVSWRVRAGALTLLWGVIGCTALLVVEALWLRLLLLVIAIGVTIHIAMIKGRGT